MKVRIEQARCQGHAQCWAAAPEVFSLDDDGYIVMDGEYPVAPQDEAAVRTAVLSCPEQVFSIVD